MATTPFEPPPTPPMREDENGNVIMTKKDWEALLNWLERFIKHVASIT